ncbi:MAG: hypothetical protein ABL967_00215 [Bryobacteraceae bacterium]
MAGIHRRDSSPRTGEELVEAVELILNSGCFRFLLTELRFGFGELDLAFWFFGRDFREFVPEELQGFVRLIRIKGRVIVARRTGKTLDLHRLVLAAALESVAMLLGLQRPLLRAFELYGFHLQPEHGDLDALDGHGGHLNVEAQLAHLDQNVLGDGDILRRGLGV